MLTWFAPAPDVYVSTINGIDLTVAKETHKSWSWLISKDGKAIKGGSCQTLQEAQAAAVKAAEV